MRELNEYGDAYLPSTLAVPTMQFMPVFKFGSRWDGLAGWEWSSAFPGLVPLPALSILENFRQVFGSSLPICKMKIPQ